MTGARNALLEAEIVRTDDVEVYRVYADWLIENGNPHGELIAVDLARETDPHNVGLASARDVLLYKYREHWLGELPTHPNVRYLWRRGYIDAVTIECREHGFGDGWATLRALPIANWLRSLDVQGGDVTLDDLAVVLAAPPPRLATLSVGTDIDAEYYYENVLNVDELIAPLAKSALLRQLRVLDLARSQFSDDGGRELLVYASAYRHLERIEIGETHINLAMVAQLREQLACVRARWHPFAFGQ